MNPEDTVSSASESEIWGDSNHAIKKPHSSSKSAIARLCRKLSPRKSPEKHSNSEGFDHVDATDGQNCDELIQRVFNYFDENGDGKISASELQSCMRTVGGEMSPEESETAVRSSDSDGDEELGLDDFAKLMDSGGEEERKEELREAFGMYAAEGGGGCITVFDLTNMAALPEITTSTGGAEYPVTTARRWVRKRGQVLLKILRKAFSSFCFSGSQEALSW